MANNYSHTQTSPGRWVKRPRDSFRAKTRRAQEAGWREIQKQKLVKPFDEARMQRRVTKVLNADIMIERVNSSYSNCERTVAAAAKSDWSPTAPYESLMDRLARLGIGAEHAAHGREYAYNYVNLVDRLIGRDAGKIIRSAFKEEGVKYSKKRDLTAEQRAETAERLLSAKTDKIIAELTERIKKGSFELKTCCRCETPKPIGEFHKDKSRKDGRYPLCKPCAQAAKAASRQLHPPDSARYNRTYRNRHPERAKESDRKQALKRKFGISIKEYDALLAKQGGHCAICPRKPNQHHRRFPVDHNHATNRIRGILCDQCNTALGLFGDNIELLRKAINYLEVGK